MTISVHRSPGRSKVSGSGQLLGPQQARLRTSPLGCQRAEPRTQTSRNLEQGSLQPARELLPGGCPQALSPGGGGLCDPESDTMPTPRLKPARWNCNPISGHLLTGSRSSSLPTDHHRPRAEPLCVLSQATADANRYVFKVLGFFLLRYN